jgi:threonine/homoserine/homoserine lactone efflux protein
MDGSLQIWLTFTLASAAVLAIPGPTVMLVVSYTLGCGRRSALATVPGVALGDFTAMSVSLLGAGAILATSATLFTVIKLLGAAYLIWLGIKIWRAQPLLDAPHPIKDKSPQVVMFFNAYMVTALNPKSIVFFIAFVPQFVNANTPLMPQFILLVATFVGLATANVALWAVLAGKIRTKVNRPATMKLLNRTGGGFLVGAGLLTATTRA